MNTKWNDTGTLAMLLAAGSPGSASAWFRNTEALHTEQLATGKDLVSEFARKTKRHGNEFSFLP